MWLIEPAGKFSACCTVSLCSPDESPGYRAILAESHSKRFLECLRLIRTYNWQASHEPNQARQDRISNHLLPGREHVMAETIVRTLVAPVVAIVFSVGDHSHRNEKRFTCNAVILRWWREWVCGIADYCLKSQNKFVNFAFLHRKVHAGVNCNTIFHQQESK